MLSVSKLGAGQEGYYLDAVAYGVEDYYLGHGEAPGRWVGSASELLDLDGQVDAAGLRAVLEGCDPADGVRWIQARKDRVPGFDLTFSAPKSVSVIYGLGDPDTVRECAPPTTVRSTPRSVGWNARAVSRAVGSTGSISWTRTGSSRLRSCTGRVGPVTHNSTPMSSSRT